MHLMELVEVKDLENLNGKRCSKKWQSRNHRRKGEGKLELKSRKKIGETTRGTEKSHRGTHRP
jgi:hypothetical protein